MKITIEHDDVITSVSNNKVVLLEDALSLSLIGLANAGYVFDVDSIIDILNNIKL